MLRLLPQITDREIMTGIKAGGQKADHFIGHLYKGNRDKVLRYIRQNNGTAPEALDVFQEAITDFWEQVLMDKFRGESKISSYIFTLCRNKWLNELKRKKRTKAKHDKGSRHTNMANPEKENDKKEIEILVARLMNNGLDEKCRNLLSLYYHQALSMGEIAARMGYKDAQNASNKKMKCVKVLRRVVDEQPGLGSLLKSYFETFEF